MSLQSTISQPPRLVVSGGDDDAGRLAILPEPPKGEVEIRARCEREDFATATDLIFRTYGTEIRNFLSGRTRSRASMEEVFSVFSEDVWKGLPSYRFQGKVRSWIYTIARNALARHMKSRQRWGSRHVASELDEHAAEVRRSITTRMGDLDQLAAVLSELSPADRELIEQRLVLAMPWRDIAAASVSAEASSKADLERESARLRKRYQMLIERVRSAFAGTRVSEVIER